jgi:acyl-CoA thioester hydrolase
VLETGERVVPPEWIDYNGHMNDACYFVAFTQATEVFLDHLGLGQTYRERTGAGLYTADAHLRFLAGVPGGATIRFRTQLLGHDAKRLHVFHQMTRDGALAATCELMFLHVADEHVTPIPPDRAHAVADLAAAHASLPRPETRIPHPRPRNVTTSRYADLPRYPRPQPAHLP